MAIVPPMVTSGDCVLSLATIVTVTVSPTIDKEGSNVLSDTNVTAVITGAVLSKVTTLPSVVDVI